MRRAGPYRFEENEVLAGVEGVENVMAYLDMNNDKDVRIPETRIYERTRWVRAAPGHGGFFFPSARLGDNVEPGQQLGVVVDPLTDEEFKVISSVAGEIIGIAEPQPVLSGYALFHVAWHEGE